MRGESRAHVQYLMEALADLSKLDNDLVKEASMAIPGYCRYHKKRGHVYTD